MCKASVKLSCSVVAGLIAVLLVEPARADATCLGSKVFSAPEVTVCAMRRNDIRRISIVTKAGFDLSAEYGLEMHRCDDGAQCSLVERIGSNAAYFPKEVSVEVASPGSYRIEYGACDEAQEVCIPGEVTFVFD